MDTRTPHQALLVYEAFSKYKGELHRLFAFTDPAIRDGGAVVLSNATQSRPSERVILWPTDGVHQFFYQRSNWNFHQIYEVIATVTGYIHATPTYPSGIVETATGSIVINSITPLDVIDSALFHDEFLRHRRRTAVSVFHDVELIGDLLACYLSHNNSKDYFSAIFPNIALIDGFDPSVEWEYRVYCADPTEGSIWRHWANHSASLGASVRDWMVASANSSHDYGYWRFKPEFNQNFFGNWDKSRMMDSMEFIASRLDLLAAGVDNNRLVSANQD
jgi:hypothetical protein